MIELSPFRPLDLTLIALLNPVVILIGFWMGRRADQWQKLVVAGFAAAFVSSVMIWVAVWLGLVVAKGIGGEAGAFVLSMLFGTMWAVIGYATRSRSQS